MKTNNGKRKYNGFTLVEAILAMVMLTIAAAGVLLPFTYGATVRAEGSERTLAAKLACDLMEKITNTSYSTILTTYASYSESQGQVKDLNGSVFTDPYYAKFSRTATCTEIYVTQQTVQTADTKVFIKATVKVYYSGQEIASVIRLIVKKDNYAIYKSWTIGS
jgi:type II secretory pathway pseudopilin PulG